MYLFYPIYMKMVVLWLFFMPCLYCNVSDAWLLPSKWRRLLISMAGTYVDLLIWIIAVFLWRISDQTTAINYMSWIVITTCGLRVLLNLNPLMKMDGYYALSDLLGVHNLRKRGRRRWMKHIRWLLWGAKRPKAVPDGKLLLWYGVTSWLFKVCFLSLILFKLSEPLQSFLGPIGLVVGVVLFVTYAKRYFKGSLGKDFVEMFRKRKKRALLLGGLGMSMVILWFNWS